MRSIPPPSRVRYTEYLGRTGSAGSETKPAKKDANGKSGRGFFTLLWKLFAELGPGRFTLAVSLGTLSVSTGLALLLPSATKFAVDYAVTDNPGPAGLPPWVPIRDRVALLWTIGALMMLISVVAVVVGMWGRWQMTRMTHLLKARLRRRAFGHAVNLPLHRIQSLKTGGVAGLLREDAGAAGDLLFTLIYNPWRAIIQLVGTLGILALVDIKMLVGGLAIIPATWLTHRQWINKIRPLYRDVKETRSTTDAHSTETFAGVRVVRGFARGATESRRFALGNHMMGRQEVLIWWRSRVLEIVWAFLVPGASVAVLLYGGSRVIKGDLTIGDVFMFSAYVLMLLGPLETLTSTATSVQTNLAAYDRVLDLMEEPKEFHGQPAGVPLSRITTKGRIEFQNVWFAYPKREKAKAVADAASTPAAAAEPDWVLKDVSFVAEPGTTTALVGASGSGKTTLSNLVARFDDPQKGRVLLDGAELTAIDVGSYRRLMGIVEQDVFLFDGTIADNIAYGRRDATDEQVRSAAKAAHASEFIERLEQGYSTMIGERGVRLSGGQRQRLAIARALLADPVVLILDEATSNLDSESEALIQQSLGRLMRGRTSFVIAHRLSTIRKADQILVLDQGRIVERGTHDELLARGGRYATLLSKQVEEDPVGPSATVANS
ncbi:MAG: ABC transporter ATP-binding protein [Tepidisphaera sp.]